MATATISKQDIKYIQRLRHALGIDDETYDDMKSSVGVASTTQLTHKQYADLLGRIRGSAQAGAWKPVHRSAKKSGMHKQPAPGRKPLLGKIEALLADMQLSWRYTDGIAKKMFGVDRVRWCDAFELRKIVAALVYHQKRKTCETSRKGGRQ